MTTVYLVDDHAILRSGVRAELQDVADITVTGEAGTVAQAITGIQDTNPDVVLLDVHMPDGGGLAVLRGVLSAGADRPRFLGLSVSDDPVDVIAVIRGGARGYVTKSIAIDELADAIRRVASGDAVFSPKLAGYVLDAFAATGSATSGGAGVPDAPGLAGQASLPSTESRRDDRGIHGTDVASRSSSPEAGGPSGVVGPMGNGAGSDEDSGRELLDTLTAREVEVMRLLARGYTYREMAARLFISVKTVETHVSNVLRKTQQSNRHSLSRWVSVNRFE